MKTWTSSSFDGWRGADDDAYEVDAFPCEVDNDAEEVGIAYAEEEGAYSVVDG